MAPVVIGPYLRKLRKDQRLSLREVENRTGVSNSYLSQIENGKRPASIDILKRLAPVYEVSLKDLMGLAGMLTDPSREARTKFEKAIDAAYMVCQQRFRKDGLPVDTKPDETSLEIKRLVVYFAGQFGGVSPDVPSTIGIKIESLKREQSLEIWLNEDDLRGAVLVRADLVPKLTDRAGPVVEQMLKGATGSVDIEGETFVDLVELVSLEDARANEVLERAIAEDEGSNLR